MGTSLATYYAKLLDMPDRLSESCHQTVGSILPLPITGSIVQIIIY